MTWLNQELRKIGQWEGKTDQQLHGAVWNQVNRSKKLIRLDIKKNNELICWKEGSKMYVALMD